jgi:hypothetical protein
VTAPETPTPKPHVKAQPLYWRVLRLRHVRPNSWQRALFFEGSLAVAVVLVLADLASAWLLLVLPAAVAAVVKGNDVLVGWLRADRPVAAPEASIADDVRPADVSEPTFAAESAPEPVEQVDEEHNVRVLPSAPKATPAKAGAPKPRAARARPGAAAARAQVSAAHTVRRRRTQPKPGDAKGRS